MAKLKLIAPNSVLPKGAKLIKPPIEKEVGGWVLQEFDARVERLGLTWLRVKGGMGGSEDWIADIPSGCVSIHDYEWREPRWGSARYESFDEACAGRIARAIEHQKHKAAELRQKAEEADESVVLLARAIARATTPGKAT